jgi:hypothetical protein
MGENFCLVSRLSGMNKVLGSSIHAPVVIIASSMRHRRVCVLACGVYLT